MLSIQLSILSLDQENNDVPLAISNRIRTMWIPSENIAFVHRIRSASEITSFPWRSKDPPFTRLISTRTSDKSKLRLDLLQPSRRSSTSSRSVYVGTPAPTQDKNWNVISSPTQENHSENKIPGWAKADDHLEEVMVV